MIRNNRPSTSFRGPVQTAGPTRHRGIDAVPASVTVSFCSVRPSDATQEAALDVPPAESSQVDVAPEEAALREEMPEGAAPGVTFPPSGRPGGDLWGCPAPESPPSPVSPTRLTQGQMVAGEAKACSLTRAPAPPVL